MRDCIKDFEIGNVGVGIVHWVTVNIFVGSCCRLPIYQSAMKSFAQVELCFDPIQFLSGMFS